MITADCTTQHNNNVGTLTVATEQLAKEVLLHLLGEWSERGTRVHGIEEGALQMTVTFGLAVAPLPPLL